MFDVCERRELKVAIGDPLLIRAGAQGKNGSITNGERLTVVGWDAEGRPVSTDGRGGVWRYEDRGDHTQEILRLGVASCGGFFEFGDSPGVVPPLESRACVGRPRRV